MVSARYHELEQNIASLRGALLPAEFDKTGSYDDPPLVSIHALSFRLLAHAEIEAYLEDVSRGLFDAAWNAWEKTKVPGRTVLALLAYSAVETCLPPRKLGGDPEDQKRYDSLDSPVQKAQAVWRHRHSMNHGVSEEHVLSLLLPLGVSAAEMDGTLLADLSSFGGERGEVAHGSALRVQKFADPKNELDRVNGLVTGLASIDALLESALEELSKVETALQS